MYVSNAERNRELKHHGILGMKWGKRQGPPYPLNPADHSAAEKKAGYQKSIDKGSSGSDKKKAESSKQSKKMVTNNGEIYNEDDAKQIIKARKELHDVDSFKTAQRDRVKYERNQWKKLGYNSYVDALTTLPEKEYDKLADQVWTKTNDYMKKRSEKSLPKKVEISEKFVDSYLNKINKDKISYQDFKKIGRYYSKEHDSWFDDDTVYEMFEYLSKSNKYKLNDKTKTIEKA